MKILCKAFIISIWFATSFLFAQDGAKRYSAIFADSIPPDETGMRNLTSVQLSKEMIPGWNVGNSLEAIGGETAWGNPLITQKLIDSVKAAGFKSVRIPVAWSNGMNTSTFEISPTLMARVEEVVNYVLNDDMYAIINIHWDGGWMNSPTYKDSVSINNRLAALWEQIAVYFRDYDDHLIFAGTNEVHVEGVYSAPTKENYTVQNSFNQTFVTTVRSTGGRNVYRHLAVQGYNTNIDYTVNFFAKPNDMTPNRLMVEVHYYDPYNFTINTETGYTTQWGNNAAVKTDTWANEAYVDAQFNKMKTKFIDSGIAVILGEYGVVARPDVAEQAEYRRYYIEYVTGSMVRHSLAPVLWDNGAAGNNGMGIFNRSTGAQAYPAIVKAIMNAVDSNITEVKISELFPAPAKFFLHQNYPNPFNPQTTILYSLPQTSTVTLRVYNGMGCEVETLINKQRESQGEHRILFNAVGLASGVYFYRLQTEYYSETKRMILLK